METMETNNEGSSPGFIDLDQTLKSKSNEKKTDLERFIELYRNFGIELKPETVIHPWTKQQYQAVKLEQGCGFDGHPGFYSVANFDLNGKFLDQGFWE